jgi:hypothetical protein
MQDGAPWHRAKATKQDLEERGVRFQLHTTHIDQVTTQLGLVPRQCSITFRIL